MNHATGKEVGRAVLARYASAPRATRAHLWVRWRVAPLLAVADAVPEEGDVLEIGCGHGLVALTLALTGPGRRVRGVDIDPGRVEAARTAAAASPPLTGVEVDVVPPRWRPSGPLDAVVLVDALYLMARDDQRELIRAGAEALAPGGALVVKDLDDRPRLKAAVARAQEHVAVRTLTPSHGRVVDPPPAELLAHWMHEAGLTTERTRLDRGRIWPHHLVVGRRR